MEKREKDSKTIGGCNISYNSIIEDNDPKTRKTKVICTLG